MLIFKSIGRGPGSLAQALREAKALVRELEDPNTMVEMMEKTPFATMGLCECSPLHNRYTSEITFDERGRLSISLYEHYEDTSETS